MPFLLSGLYVIVMTTPKTAGTTGGTRPAFDSWRGESGMRWKEVALRGSASIPLISQRTGTRKERSKMEQLFNITVFMLFLVLWAAFAYALVANQGGLDSLWQWSRSLPLVAQAVIWLLTLPLAIALWIWESGWPIVVRLVLVLGIGGWNIWMFYPFKG